MKLWINKPLLYRLVPENTNKISNILISRCIEIQQNSSVFRSLISIPVEIAAMNISKTKRTAHISATMTYFVLANYYDLVPTLMFSNLTKKPELFSKSSRTSGDLQKHSEEFYCCQLHRQRNFSGSAAAAQQSGSGDFGLKRSGLRSDQHSRRFDGCRRRKG